MQARTVILILTIVATGVVLPSCGGDSTSLFKSSEVRAAFEREGLPLEEVSLRNGVIVKSGRSPLPVAVFNSAEGRGFYVQVYDSADAARNIAANAPKVDPIFRQRQTFLVERNVFVVVRPPNATLAARIESALR